MHWRKNDGSPGRQVDTQFNMNDSEAHNRIGQYAVAFPSQQLCSRVLQHPLSGHAGVLNRPKSPGYMSVRVFPGRQPFNQAKQRA